MHLFHLVTRQGTGWRDGPQSCSLGSCAFIGECHGGAVVPNGARAVLRWLVELVVKQQMRVLAPSFSWVEER